MAGAGARGVEVPSQRGSHALVPDDVPGHVLAGAVAGPQVPQEAELVVEEAARLVAVRAALERLGRGVDGGLAREGAGAQVRVHEVRAPGGGVARREEEREELLLEVVVGGGVGWAREGEVLRVDGLELGAQEVDDLDGRRGVEVGEVAADDGVDEQAAR